MINELIQRVSASFEGIAPNFELWVKMIEEPTRRQEVEDILRAGIQNPRLLIISPPTDPGIKILVERLCSDDVGARITLLCFNDKLMDMAKTYLGDAHNKVKLITLEKGATKLPFEPSSLDIVVTNCFFDFCLDREIDEFIGKITEMLSQSGLLFSVHMDSPQGFTSGVWAKFFKSIPALSHGCHPVNINDALEHNGFTLVTDRHVEQFGFPVKYVQGLKG